MPTNIWMAFLTSFVGTLGFAALLNAPKRAWLPASLIGGVGYTLFWVLLVDFGVSEPGAVFVGALVGSVLAQYAARRMRMIATVFMTLSIIAFVPGLGLYRCMSLLGQGEDSLGLQAGVLAMSDIVMIALGLAIGSFLFRAVTSRLGRPRPCICKEEDKGQKQG